MKNATKLIIAAVLAAAAVACLIADAALHARERSMSGWTAADAVVLGVTIDRRTGPGGEAGYAPVVDYRFLAGGVEYQGQRLGLDREWSASLDEVKRWVQPALEGAQLMPGQSGGMFGAVYSVLPVDKRITVYYDPADPGRNIADRRDPRAVDLFRWLGALLLLAGLAGTAWGVAPLLAGSARRPRATWVGDVTRRDEPAMPQDRFALTIQLALDMAFEATVRFAKGGPDPLATLRERFPSLGPVELDDIVSKAKVLESVSYGTAARVKSGMVQQEDALAELAASYPGFSEQTYRSALAWGLQQCK
ncbi:MAG: DUF3592 domain-containing protein [Candidatus Edwardsbacteria bacterium]|nr:DUF3592 domain-containing protein [Candidatus Edwardsbacteria bacterium]